MLHAVHAQLLLRPPHTHTPNIDSSPHTSTSKLARTHKCHATITITVCQPPFTYHHLPWEGWQTLLVYRNRDAVCYACVHTAVWQTKCFVFYAAAATATSRVFLASACMRAAVRAIPMPTACGDMLCVVACGSCVVMHCLMLTPPVATWGDSCIHGILGTTQNYCTAPVVENCCSTQHRFDDVRAVSTPLLLPLKCNRTNHVFYDVSPAYVPTTPHGSLSPG